MKRSLLIVKSTILFLGGLLLAIIGFYSFVTADRHGYVSKEFEEGLIYSLSNSGFRIEDSKDILSSEVPLSSIQGIRLSLKRVLHRTGLMHHGYEHGKQYNIFSNDNAVRGNVKALFVGDHLLALAVELNEKDIKPLRKNLEQEFRKYTVLWKGAFEGKKY